MGLGVARGLWAIASPAKLLSAAIIGSREELHFVHPTLHSTPNLQPTVTSPLDHTILDHVLSPRSVFWFLLNAGCFLHVTARSSPVFSHPDFSVVPQLSSHQWLRCPKILRCWLGPLPTLIQNDYSRPMSFL